MEKLGTSVDKMCSNVSDKLEALYSESSLNTCGDSLLAVEETLSLCGLAGFFEDYAPVFLAGKNVYRI